jgi:prephenate dehydratase
MAVAAMVVVLLNLSAQFLYVHSSSDACTVVSPVLESCYIALQSGESFMKSESVCCKSLEILENRIRDSNHQFTRYAVCECFKASDNDKQILVNENLLEVQALCGPHVPYPITSYSDCLQYVSAIFSYF